MKLEEKPERYRRGRSMWIYLALHLLRVVVEVMDWLDGDHQWW